MSTDFLYDLGPSGFIRNYVAFGLGASLNALANAGTVSSDTANQNNSLSAIFGYVWFKSGGAFTPTAGSPAIYLWWLMSPDGGTTFEKSSAVPPRQPDCIIPLPAAAIASGDIFAAPPPVRLWAPSVKLMAQNNTGVALPATGNTIFFGPIAIQY